MNAFYRLRDRPWLVDRVARIYATHWLDHFEEEYGLATPEAIGDDLRLNFMDSTFVAMDDAGDFVGTVALLDEDLRTHAHLGPWVTCLYVEPWARGCGAAKALATYAAGRHSGPVYLWCRGGGADEDRYRRWGARVVERIGERVVMEYRADRPSNVPGSFVQSIE